VSRRFLASSFPRWSNTEALFGFAKEIGAGLMVMGAFAHSRLAHLFHGSVTRGLSNARPSPFICSTDVAMKEVVSGSTYMTPGWAVIPFVGYLVLIAMLPLFAGGSGKATATS
jgi:hypothetical protein